MTERAPFRLKGRNPDVLSCIANLSNDEVFTPPKFANRMLDTLAEAWAGDNDGSNIWESSAVTFLDPCTKSGVFLREIAKRLIDGLANEIPDLQERVNHILTQQVFGIGITQLTALLARRSLYCSKSATSEHSVVTGFDDADGNIWFERTEHNWKNGKCVFCGTGKSAMNRGGEAESHAYALIHTNDIKTRLNGIFGESMQFDVIIGNPPYQLASDGGTRDKPIYQLFVQQAKKLNPTYMSMVIPSRWMATGLGLDEFRSEMLNDNKVETIVDYPVASDVFPGVAIKAGVCYFLRNLNHEGDCNVTMIRNGEVIGEAKRDLSEFDIFVRDIKGAEILAKVQQKRENSINKILARDKEFGWTSNFSKFNKQPKTGDIPLYHIKSMKRSVGFIARQEVKKSEGLVDKWKVLVPAAYGGGNKIPHPVLGKPILAPSPSVCTQSFLFFYTDTKEKAESILSYYQTRFFRFMVSLRKITQHGTHSTYSWVPEQAWNRIWTDEALYEKYGITEDQQAYIESQVREMVLETN